MIGSFEKSIEQDLGFVFKVMVVVAIGFGAVFFTLGVIVGRAMADHAAHKSPTPTERSGHEP